MPDHPPHDRRLEPHQDSAVGNRPAAGSGGATGPGGAPLPQIRRFALGPWQTNCYLVTVPGSSACWIVDAGFEPAPMIEAIRSGGLQPERVVLTHAHLDHIGGLHEIVKAFGRDLPIAIHRAERDFLTDPAKNLSMWLDMNIVAPEATQLLDHGDTLELAGGGAWKILHTPGHSPGGITLHHAASRTALVGDTLFADSIGRYDFPTSNGGLLIRSIRDKLLTLPDETRVCPGHGPETTIGRERNHNPFLQPGAASDLLD